VKALKKLFGCWMLLLLVAAATQAQDGFYLKNGDRVVFYGDSITDQRLYTTFVESYVATRFPKLDVSFVHSGWGGDRVTGGAGGSIEVRLPRDVVAYKPTVVTVMLGMNDGRYRAFDQQIFETYANGYQKIVQRLKTALPGVRMTLIQPSPYDDVTRAATFEGGYNAVLLRYGQFVKELASKERLDVADLNSAVIAALKKAHATDAANAQKIIPDRIHPGAGGHLLMAAELLKSWKAPAVVSSVEIDVGKSSVLRVENTQVTDLKTESGLTWAQTDNSLPWPIDMNDAATALAVKSSDVMESLNRQLLKVAGLTAARYQLKLDGEVVGDFTKEQLSDGVNLSWFQTPMSKQAAAVHALTLRHNTLHFTAWRQVQVPFQNSKSANVAKAIEVLHALEQEVIAEQRAAAQPKPHRYALTPK
jgi:lysophospholipase L1-like esterase